MHRIARHGRVHLGDPIFQHVVYFLESTAALLLGLGVVERAPRGDDLRDRRVAQARLLVEHDLGQGGHGELGLPVPASWCGGATLVAAVRRRAASGGLEELAARRGQLYAPSVAQLLGRMRELLIFFARVARPAFSSGASPSGAANARLLVVAHTSSAGGAAPRRAARGTAESARTQQTTQHPILRPTQQGRIPRSVFPERASLPRAATGVGTYINESHA